MKEEGGSDLNLKKEMVFIYISLATRSLRLSKETSHMDKEFHQRLREVAHGKRERGVYVCMCAPIQEYSARPAHFAEFSKNGPPPTRFRNFSIPCQTRAGLKKLLA